MGTLNPKSQDALFVTGLGTLNPKSQDAIYSNANHYGFAVIITDFRPEYGITAR